MKILHLITGLGIGGAEIALCNFLEDEATQSDEHCVAYFYAGPCVERLQRSGVRLYHIKGLLRGYDPLGIWKFYSLVRLIRPDIIHTALWAANQVGRYVGYVAGVPVISELHGNVAYEGVVRNIAELVSAPFATVIVAVSKGVYNSYEALLARYLPVWYAAKVSKKVSVIPNGIKSLSQGIVSDCTRYDLGLSDDDFVIGAVGRLVPIKGYDVLLTAMANLFSQYPMLTRKTKLCLIGDGPLRAALWQQVVEFGLVDNVIMLGQVSNVRAIYTLFDCFVQPSRSEGLSLALLEAMDSGLVVVVSSTDRGHDVVDNGINGFVAAAGDCYSLAEALKRVIFLDLERKELMVSNNQKKVREQYSYNRLVLAYQALYKSVRMVVGEKR